MARLDDVDFDDDAAGGDSVDCLPAAKYLCVITESPKKTSQTGNDYMELKFQIVEDAQGGRFKNWTFYENLNLWHSRHEVAGRAKKTMKGICSALNVESRDIKDSSELHNRKLVVKTKIEKGTSGYRDKARPCGFDLAQNWAPTEQTTRKQSRARPEDAPW